MGKVSGKRPDTSGGNCGCGAPVQAGASYCGECGRKIELAPVEAVIRESTCPTCGEAVSDDATFCGGCGLRLETVLPEVTSVSTDDDEGSVPDFNANPADEPAPVASSGKPQQEDMARRAGILMVVGGGFLVIAFLWWSGFYGSLAREAGRSLSFFNSCLWSSGGICGLAAAAAQKAGQTPYSPMVFWIGVIALVAGGIFKAMATPGDKAVGTLDTPSAVNTKKYRSSVTRTAPWTRDNDRLVEEIFRSNTQPHDAMESIKELLVKGININAQNAQGRTTLSIAKYHECPFAVITLLINAGAKE